MLAAFWEGGCRSSDFSGGLLLGAAAGTAGGLLGTAMTLGAGLALAAGAGRRAAGCVVGAGSTFGVGNGAAAVVAGLLAEAGARVGSGLALLPNRCNAPSTNATLTMPAVAKPPTRASRRVPVKPGRWVCGVNVLASGLALSAPTTVGALSGVALGGVALGGVPELRAFCG